MTPDEVNLLVGTLAAAFPAREMRKETVRVYAKYLADVDPAAARRAIDKLIVAETFFPSIGQIRREIAREVSGHESPEAAWLLVQRATYYPTRFAGSGGWEIDLEKLPPLAARVAASMSASDIAEGTAAARAHFLRIHAQMAEEDARGINLQSLEAGDEGPRLGQAASAAELLPDVVGDEKIE